MWRVTPLYEALNGARSPKAFLTATDQKKIVKVLIAC